MLKTTARGPRPQTHVTIVSKAGMLAFITFTTTPDGALIVSRDPRQPQPKRREYKTPFAAVAAHANTLATTVRNGWRVAYSGPPLRG